MKYGARSFRRSVFKSRNLSACAAGSLFHPDSRFRYNLRQSACPVKFEDHFTGACPVKCLPNEIFIL